MKSNDAEYSPLKGMRAMVTGGAQGIGSGLCFELASAGAAVAIVDLQAKKANIVANKIVANGGIAFSILADLASEGGCHQAVTTAIDGLRGLDILVNCAAPSRNKMMLGKLTDADWAIHQQIVLNATVLLADAASEYLAASGRGVIVNISSVTSNSIAIDHCSWPYHVSKAGLDHLTRFLAVRLGKNGIRVNAIAPGLVDRDEGPKLSDSFSNRSIINEIVPLGRAGTAHDISQVLIFLCSKQSAYITGQVLTVDGGLGLNDVFSASLRAYKSGADSSS
jgi:glucose 1-dehydrogenase